MYHNKCNKCNDPNATKVIVTYPAGRKILWLCKKCVNVQKENGFFVAPF